MIGLIRAKYLFCKQICRQRYIFMLIKIVYSIPRTLGKILWGYMYGKSILWCMEGQSNR
jgi:hypothetical protein